MGVHTAQRFSQRGSLFSFFLPGGKLPENYKKPYLPKALQITFKPTNYGIQGGRVNTPLPPLGYANDHKGPFVKYVTVKNKNQTPSGFGSCFFPPSHILSLFYPYMMGASLVSLFSWPVDIELIIGVVSHMCCIISSGC